MRQLIQNARNGSIELADVPAPKPTAGQVLVENRHSVMSPGTDKLAMSFARMSMLGKARSRPDLVRQVMKKLQSDGPVATYRAATSRLDSPQPLGYSSAGIVREVGPGVTNFSVGDRVACAGAGYANHAELVVVPENLVVAVPDGVELRDAAFATLGAIALQGVRIAEPTLGEYAVVVGLGLIGQISVQLLRANGCRVLGVDLDPERNKQALEQGASWAIRPDELSDAMLTKLTDGHGFDLALVTAASPNSAPLEFAANSLRRKGRISFVGAMPIEIDRRIMFEKELDLRTSTSYGPGRYDRNYEELGLDYPIAYVRWTENRNLSAFIDLAETQSIKPSALNCTSRDFTDSVESYEALQSGGINSLAVVFDYGEDVPLTRVATIAPTGARTRKSGDQVGIAFIGAGAYAKSMLLPIVSAAKSADPITLVTSTGASATGSAKRFGFSGCSTDPEAALQDPNVDLVFVTTRHDTHVEYAVEALRAGKGVWLEKPAALSTASLATLVDTLQETQGFLTIGYNRRFSPHATRAAEVFRNRASPLHISYRVIPGPMPAGTWIVDPNEGGGRLIGEACHFVDLCTYLVGSLVESVETTMIGDGVHDDSFSTTARFLDGSSATIDYLAGASTLLPKERVEISGDGRTVVIDNFRVTSKNGAKLHRTLNQDKGQSVSVHAAIDAYRQGAGAPISLESIVNTSMTTFAMVDSAGAASRIVVPSLG